MKWIISIKDKKSRRLSIFFLICSTVLLENDRDLLVKNKRYKNCPENSIMYK